MEEFDELERFRNRWIDCLLPLAFTFLLCAVVSAVLKQGMKDIRKDSNHVSFDDAGGRSDFCR
jgi:uncharacterized membrane protein (GlpM family)